MSSSTKRLTLPVLGPLTSSMGVQNNSAGGSSFQKLPTPGDSGGRKLSAAMLATSPPTPVPPSVATPTSAAAAASSSGSPATSVLMCEELRKISDGKPMFKTSRKWFVLYDDNLEPLQGGGRGSETPQPADPPLSHVPAHLEYHDSEKKWREGKAPNRDIVLRDCFNIYKKKDKEGLNGHIISLCTLKDSLDIVFENERDLLTWMELLLCCQQGGRSSTGKLKRPIYENMWEVNVKGFKPVQADDHSKDRSSSSRSASATGSAGGAGGGGGGGGGATGSDAKDTFTNKTKFQMSGLHRMVVTQDTVKFFELGAIESKNFPIHYISGHSEGKSRYLKLGTGWHSIAGRGELELDVKDQTVSEAIIAAIFKPGHLRIGSTSSSRSSKSSMHDPSTSSTAKTIATNYRPRSESWSNPPLAHSLTEKSGKGIIGPGYHNSTQQSKTGSHNSRHSSSRNRTSSEGNHFDIAGKRGKSSIMSSSPMSPGSCMSSESAGSSNSIDDHGDDGAAGGGLVHRGTPVEGGLLGGVGGGPTPTAAATIFEESSGESWLDPVTVLEEEQRARLANTSSTATLEPERGITYTEVDCSYGSSSVKCPSSSSSSRQQQQQQPEMGTSPPGQLHYATIVDPTSMGGAAGPPQSNYTMMSPPPKVTSGSSSSSSSLKRQTSTGGPGSRSGTLERERRMLSMLGLTEAPSTPLTSPTTAAADAGGEEYTLMSPTPSDGLVLGYHPFPSSSHHHHSRTASVPRQASEDYVDMTIPPPPRKSSVKHVSSSPSAALTSHLSGGPLLPLYTDVSCGGGSQNSASAPPTGASGSAQTTTTTLVSVTAPGAPPGDVDSPYLLMSPVSVPASSAAAATSTPEISSSSIIGRLMGEAGGPSVIAPPPPAGAEGTEEGIYIAMDFSSAQSDSLPPPPPAAAPVPLPKPKRMSPTSSCSLVSGTPTSVTGSTGDFLHNRFASAASECCDEDVQVSNAKSKNIDIPCAKDSSVPSGASGSASESDKFANTSPGGSMASRLGQWFRHRAGSVPARPVLSGRRRHRTQSEGDPEAIAAKASGATPRD